MLYFLYRNLKETLFTWGVISFVVFQSALAAGTGVIKGKVVDKASNEALPGATVLLKGTNLGAATDLNGNYTVANVPVGNYTLIVTYVGYRTSTVPVEVVENQTVEKIIRMEATAVTGKEVVVTAQAQGQLGAINQQLSSNTIENVVSRARIQELPDQNAAESVGRLPGVSIERYNGQATKIEIRGLDPKYSLVTINGIQIPSTSTTDRSVDLSLIPSNMLDGITLKKVVTPDMNADVLGGTVNLQLKEAPEGLHANLSALGGYNQLQSYYGDYNFEGSVSDRFLDDKLGVIVSLHADNYDRSADKFQDNYFSITNSSNLTGGVTLTTQELLLRAEKVNQKRTGASLLLDYKIPYGKITGNGFFNQQNSNGLYNINDMYTPNASYNSNRLYYQEEQTNDNTKIFTSALGVRQDFNWLKYDLSVSRSGSHYLKPNDRVWQFDQESDGFSFVPKTMAPIDIPGKATVDTNKTQLANVYIYGIRLNEDETSSSFNVQVPWRLGDQANGFFKGGAQFRWVSRSNGQSQVGYNGINYGSSGGANPILSALSKQFPTWGSTPQNPQWNIDTLATKYGGLPVTPFLTSYPRSKIVNGQYPVGFVFNPTMLNQMTDFLQTSKYWLNYAIGSLGNNYSGAEDYQAAYIMAELDLGNFLTIIPGVRWEGEHTVYNGQSYEEVTVNNQEGPPADLTPLTTTRNSSYWLPDVNLIVRPTDWLQVKLARTETLARPDYIEYAPITYVNSTQTSINAVNSSLHTSHSTNYDAALSIYDNTIGLLSGDAFYKKIDNLIFYSTFILEPGLTPPGGLNIPSYFYSSGAPQVNTYMNNPNPSTYYGIELEWQTNFWYLPSVLHGLVLDVNFTHIFSQMKLQYDSLTSKITGFPPHQTYAYVQRSVTTRMPDQPDFIFNVTLGYDLGGFSARVSYLYQDNKLIGIGYLGTVPSPLNSSYTGAYARWDLTLQQKLNEHFQVFADFNNLNNRPDINYTGSLSNPNYIEYYGFTMDLGVRYNL